MRATLKMLCILTLLGLQIRAKSQDKKIFSRFTVKDIRFTAQSNTDTVVTKTYILTNRSGDSLFLFQQVPFKFKHGKGEIQAVPVTERFIYIQKDSCYSIGFHKDTSAYNDIYYYRKYNKVEFFFKEQNGSICQSDNTNGFYIYSVGKETP